ncbi:MucR family transcriptional regulator [Enterobacter huaxiensis]|uniref:MucR family transcriptional regulator n=1 Tax=Enterobacter huaxiensis TaxID=2494702 RepID=UPI0021D9B6FE|nr:MucR family transcriptional regulator [Enterobacter huaxiensis]
MATEGDTRERIVCRECGREFIFLAPHLRVAHGMTANEYRERWDIPKHVALASAEHSQNCRDSVISRIRRGELDPAEQVRMMAEANGRLHGNSRSSRLHRQSASETASRYRIWETSPAVKTVSPDVRREALRRMKSRKKTGETVRSIAEELNLSISCLYRWQSGDK